MDFRMTNELAEIRAGLRPEPTKLQKLAEERTILQRGIRFMRGPAGVPPVMKANYDFHVQQLAKVEKEIEELTKAESDRKELEEATAKSRAKYASQDADTRAIAMAMAAKNPEKTSFELGGVETQELFEKVASVPLKKSEADPNTCSYCQKPSIVSLKYCARCNAVRYCDANCQKLAWKGHKLECQPAEKKTKGKLPLSWAQLAEFKGVAEGRELVVRVMLNDKFGPKTVLKCKDSQGIVKPIVLVENGGLDRVVPGTVLRWKEPRFDTKTDGALLESSDLLNITLDKSD
ncbi:hypothetical protein HDU99_006809 [Rhizoclosmatium hyalinum]|nr:hypothetical protein HDU99_006809 [Rhizoclosmatium hyalinum]